MWQLSTGIAEPSELSEHLDELLDRVEPMRDALLGLCAEGYEMDWFCYVASTATEHAAELDGRLLARLASLPGALLIDIYENPPDS